MRRPGDEAHLEVHLMDDDAGHEMSTDCWCEPKYYWVIPKSPDAPLMFVVEHDDDSEPVLPRSAVLHKRATERDWITVLMDSLKGS
jgi:hypothetical protein